VDSAWRGKQQAANAIGPQASSDRLCLGQGRGAKGMLVPGQFLAPPRNGYMKYGWSRPPSTRLVGPS
jgi:hypothetical protein